KQDGTPDVGARVVAVLNRFDTDDGYVGPTEVEAIADSTGTAILELWPNERGATESMYRVRIEGSERTLTTMAVVAEVEAVDLEDIAPAPAYPGRTEGEIALAQMAVYVGQAQQAALDAAEAAEEAGDAARDAAEAAGDAAR